MLVSRLSRADLWMELDRVPIANFCFITNLLLQPDGCLKSPTGPYHLIPVLLPSVMTIKRRRTAESQDDESEEESDMGMDVVPIQEHPCTEVRLGLPSDPFTSQVGSHVEFVVQPMLVRWPRRWTPTEHSASDRELMSASPCPPARKFRILHIVLTEIAGQINKEIPLEEALWLIGVKAWLRDLPIACRKKSIIQDIRRLPPVYTFPVNVVL